jgi:two-component system, NtrC family, sensor kinase
MDFNVILPFIQATFTAILLSLVLRHPRHNTETRWFSVFLSGMTLWGLTIGMMRVSDLVASAVWEKAALVAIALTVVSFYYFAMTHIHTYSRLFNALPAIFFIFTVIVSPTSLLVEGMGVDRFGRAPDWNILLYPWFVILYTIMLAAIFRLNQARIAATSYEAKNRYLYLIIGTGICFLGGISDVLPALGINIYPSSIITNMAFALLTAIAILRYQLLDIRVVIRKSAAYILTSMVVAVPYVGAIAWFSLLFQKTLPIWLNILLVLVLALGLQIVWQRVQTTVDRWFYRERYDFLRELEKFSQEAHDISNLNELGSSLINLISRAFQVANVHLFLVNEAGNFRTISSIGTETRQITLQRRSQLVQWLNKNKSILERQQLDVQPQLQGITSQERGDIIAIDARLFIPLITNTRELIGLLILGPKKSEQLYSKDELGRMLTITSRVAIELESARLYAQETAMRQELQKLDKQKTEFLHHVAHELKTPLTAIISSSELMTAEEIPLIPLEQRERLLSNINRSAWLMDKKVGELLNLARIQIGRVELKLEPLSLNEIVEDITSQLSSLFKNKEQSVETNIPIALPRVKADREKIEEIVLNLLSNANKFSPAGGHILILASEKDEMVLVEVKDSSPIISNADKERIFESYYRGGTEDDQARVSGLGLGLAISKSLVEMQGGEIGVTSEEGRGNTFYFTVPLWKDSDKEQFALHRNEGG